MAKNVIREELENCLSFDVFKKRIWNDRGLNDLISEADRYFKNYRLKYLFCKIFSYPYKTFYLTKDNLTYTNEYSLYLDFQNKRIALAPAPEYQFSTLLVQLGDYQTGYPKISTDDREESYIESAFSIFEDEQPEMYFPVVDYFQLHLGFSGIKTKILKDISGNKFPDMEDYKEKLVKHLFKHFCKNAKRILEHPISSLTDDFGYLPFSDFFDSSVKKYRSDFLSKKLISTDEFQEFTKGVFFFKKLVLDGDVSGKYFNVSESVKIDFLEKLEEFLSNDSMNKTIYREYVDQGGMLVKSIGNVFDSIVGLRETLNNFSEDQFPNIRAIVDDVK